MSTTIEKKINYTFKDKSYLELALTHKSLSSSHNERLEFLGDAILSSVITAEIFKQFADQDEGDLSRLRAKLINKEKLIEVANKLGISGHIKVSNSEKKSATQITDAILADTIEAIIGAIFSDSDWSTCNETVISWYEPDFKDPKITFTEKDPKTKLQEYLQALARPVPQYSLLETSGLSHKQIFTIECSADGIDISSKGTGKTIKKAQQNAAEEFLTILQTKDIL
jgi:ribonuclease III